MNHNPVLSLLCPRHQLAAVYNALCSLYLKDKNIVSWAEIAAACPELGSEGGNAAAWSKPETLATGALPLLGLVGKAATLLVLKMLADLMVSDAQMKAELMADKGEGGGEGGSFKSEVNSDFGAACGHKLGADRSLIPKPGATRRKVNNIDVWMNLGTLLPQMFNKIIMINLDHSRSFYCYDGSGYAKVRSP
jgi:hypothetical protein